MQKYLSQMNANIALCRSSFSYTDRLCSKLICKRILKSGSTYSCMSEDRGCFAIYCYETYPVNFQFKFYELFWSYLRDCEWQHHHSICDGLTESWSNGIRSKINSVLIFVFYYPYYVGLLSQIAVLLYRTPRRPPQQPGHDENILNTNVQGLLLWCGGGEEWRLSLHLSCGPAFSVYEYNLIY